MAAPIGLWYDRVAFVDGKGFPAVRERDREFGVARHLPGGVGDLLALFHAGVDLLGHGSGDLYARV